MNSLLTQTVLLAALLGGVNCIKHTNQIFTATFAQLCRMITHPFKHLSLWFISIRMEVLSHKFWLFLGHILNFPMYQDIQRIYWTVDTEQYCNQSKYYRHLLVTHALMNTRVLLLSVFIQFKGNISD